MAPTAAASAALAALGAHRVTANRDREPLAASRERSPEPRVISPDVARRYREDLDRLTSRANWARLYDVDE